MNRTLLVLSMISLTGMSAPEVQETVLRPSGSGITLTAGAAAFAFREQGYAGLDVNFAGHLGRGVFVGLGMGVGYRGTDVTTPILATVEWRLPGRGLRPFLGAGIGSVVQWGGNRTPLWQLALFAKPGAEWRLGDAIALRFEPRIGFFARDFVFAPVLGATVTL